MKRIISPIYLSFMAALLFLSACNSGQLASDSKGSSHADTAPTTTSRMLFDFESGEVSPSIQLINAKASIDTYTDLTGKPSKGLKLEMKSKQHSYAGIAIEPQQPWDWSEFTSASLYFDITSLGDQSTQFYLDVTDKNGAVFTRSIDIPVGAVKSYYGKLSGHDLVVPDSGDVNDLNLASGLRSNPPTWTADDRQFVWMWGVKNLDLSGVARVSLSVQSAMHDKTVIIDNIRIQPNPPQDENFLVGLVDKFGQNAKQDYKGKIHSLSELHAARDAELAKLDGKPMPGRSTFGGWLAGPKLNATGFFRTEKIDGKWMLVDPEGYPYFATGLDIIRLSNSSTMTGYDYDQSKVVQRAADDVTPEDSKGLMAVSEQAFETRYLASETRAKMFKWLPTYDHALSNHYNYRRSAHSGPLKRGEAYSFYSANLERKYGETYPGSYLDKWREVTVDRMLNWGFTSLGNWTDPSYYDNNRIPFFANGWVIGDFKTVSSGADFWGAMPDVFDPEFKVRAMETARVVSDEVKNSPWCVGVFIDNEKSFGRPDSDKAQYGIPIHTLGRPNDGVPTRQAFSKLLKEKYKTITALNNAWGLKLSSWAEFDKGVDVKDLPVTAVLREDYSMLLSAYAEQYFKVVEAAVTHYLPNHLYLGARFPDWGMPMEVVKAAAKYADVVSYNSYKEGLPNKKWAFLAELDKPSIIGEFHIGAMDHGSYHPGLIHAASQADRGEMYKDYMQSVIDNPYFVGAHWFQYMDSPLTGRAYDGENYNVGFVDVTDTPYQEMVDAAKEVNAIIYTERLGKK